MEKIKIFYPDVFLLSWMVFFISGCAYLTHPNETLFLKSLGDNQNAMQAQLDREEKLFSKLKTDIDNGRLSKPINKTRIFSLYGEPTLCKAVEDQGKIKETCIYRQPGGLSTQLILINLDAQDELSSWEIQSPDK